MLRHFLRIADTAVSEILRKTIVCNSPLFGKRLLFTAAVEKSSRQVKKITTCVFHVNCEGINIVRMSVILVEGETAESEVEFNSNVIRSSCAATTSTFFFGYREAIHTACLLIYISNRARIVILQTY